MPLPVAKLVMTAVMMAANYAMTAMRKIEGPRLDDLSVTLADFGTPFAEVYGERRVSGLPIIWAEPLTAVERTSKTKGGKYNDVQYFGTWAMALAGHEIDALAQLFLDKHLVLDFKNAGPITPFPIGVSETQKKGGTSTRTIRLNDHVSIYLGTKTQLPDERIVTTEGAAFAPAFRDVAYIVLKDVPLEKFGNRIPSADALLIRSAEPNFLQETFTTTVPVPDRMRLFGVSQDGGRLLFASGTSYEMWDLASRSPMITGTLPANPNRGSFVGDSDGNWYYVPSGFSERDPQFISADGTSGGVFWDIGTIFSDERPDDMFVVVDGEGNQHIAARSSNIFTSFFFDGPDPINLSTYVPSVSSLRVTSVFTDAYGDVWLFAQRAADNETTAYFFRWVHVSDRDTPGLVTVTGLPSRGAHDDELDLLYSGALHYADDTADHFIFPWTSTRIYAADAQTGAIVFTQNSISLDDESTGKQLRWVTAGSETVWVGSNSTATELNLADLTVARSLSLGGGGPWGAVDVEGFIYIPMLHALLAFGGGVGAAGAADYDLHFLYLDRVQDAGMTLGYIAGDQAEQCGIVDYDFSALDQLVPGWSATPGPSDQKLEPLFDAYDSDVRLHDFTVQGVKRGGAAGAAITSGYFVGGKPTFNVRRKQPPDLPRALQYNFADTTRDQQPNNVRPQRQFDLTGAREDRTIDVSTLAGTPSYIRSLADRHFRRIWNSRMEITGAVSAQQLALEPGDVRTLVLDGEPIRSRLVKLTFSADDTMPTEWVEDPLAVNALLDAEGADALGQTAASILVPQVTKGLILDMPLVRDAHNESVPILYYGAGPYNVGFWPGANFYRLVGGDYSERTHATPFSSAMTWGIATNALGVADPWLWDRGNSLNIRLQTGSLVSSSEAGINSMARTNLFALRSSTGWEILNFATATLEGDGTYTLTGLRRGRRGSEMFVAGHAVNDMFVLLDSVEYEKMDASELNTAMSWKAITEGRNAVGAEVISLTYAGVSHKPYAPAHIRWVYVSSTGDWILSWKRRSRIGGFWQGGTVIPIGEASEEYEIDILNGVTIVRAVTGLAVETFTYTSAMQTTDFGAPLTVPPDANIYQISDLVGRGFAAAA